MGAAQEASKEAHEQAHSAAQAAAASAAFSFPTMTGPEDYLQNVGSFVAAALDPLGIDVKIDIETPEGRKSCHVSRQTSSASAEASAETSSGQENEKEAKKEDEVANTEEKRWSLSQPRRLILHLMMRRSGLSSMTRRRQMDKDPLFIPN